MMRWLKQSWFGLSLLAILVLAIPGLWLFGLNVLGHETATNKFLEERFNLTYHIPIPWWGALLLFLVPPLLILLYFLKLKRKPLSVPSTFLWKKSIEDLHVNSLFQWLRQNVLLLLQLLSILALVYGILAPRFHGATGRGKHYILMIDNSASMSASDVQPTRLDLAKAEALKEIDAAGDDDHGMVIVFNSVAEIRQSYTSNRHLLRSVVRNIGPTQRTTRIDEALALADSLANPTRSSDNEAVKPENVEPGQERVFVPTEGIETELHLFSDGRFPDAPTFALGNLRPRLHTIGQTGPENADNVALVNFNAVRDETDASKVQLFARVLNFRPRPSAVTVTAEVRIDGRLHKVLEPQKVQLPARRVVRAEPPKDTKDAKDAAPQEKDEPGEAGVTFDLPDVDDRTEMVVRGRIADARDQFPHDDEAWLVVGVIRKAKVLIVGKPNQILDAFFKDEATKQVSDVTHISAEDLKDGRKYLEPARTGEYDLVIFDRCAPSREDEMPRANTFFIGHPPPPWTTGPADATVEKRIEKVEGPTIKGWTGQHGLLKYLVGLHEIGISDAFKMHGLPPRTPRLMESDQDVALMVVLSRGAYVDGVMCFPILTDAGEWNTTWPILPSFPIFWRNVLYALGNIRDAAGEETLQPGQVKLIRPEGRVQKVEVTDPQDQTTALERGNRADFAYGATDRLGTYTAAWEGGARRFAVNLLDAEESNVEPRVQVQFGAETVTQMATRRQPRELWKWAVLAALGVLLLEWYVYNRRVFI